MKTKLSITEVYRLDTELEVEQFISDERVKADKEGYELKGYKSAKKEKDFARSIGKLVEGKLFCAVNGTKEFCGILTAYDNKTVTIVPEDEDTPIVLERSNISTIRLAFV